MTLVESAHYGNLISIMFSIFREVQDMNLQKMAIIDLSYARVMN